MHLPMLMQVSPAERVTAVHEHFSSRSWSDAGTVIFVALLLAIGLSAMLLILNRAQQRRRAENEREHTRRRDALIQSAHRPGLHRRF